MTTRPPRPAPAPPGAGLPPARLDALVRDLTRPARAVVLLDGPSGAGKSTLARALLARWPRRAQLLSLDDVYPGWTGLAAGSAAVPGMVRGEDPGYRRWDWTAGRPAEWVALDPGVDLVVEGCGALTPENRVLATAALWLAGPAEDVRRARALARDGEGYAPHWDTWAAQEAEHWRRHRPWELADVRLAPVD